MDSNIYFASLPREEIAPELMRRVDDWYNNITASGHFARMKRSYNAYHGISDSGTSSEIARGGIQGELALIKVNHFRNLIQHMKVMTTQTRPAMEARSINTDYKSQAQATLANGILDYYMREKELEKYLVNAVEIALVLGEAYIGLEWDEAAGHEYDVDPETNRIIFTGDLKYRNYYPIDIIKDLYLENSYDHEWMIVRTWKNRFSLAAKFKDDEELADSILNMRTKDRLDMSLNWFNKSISDSELIPMYVFYHKRTEALPEGRMVVYLDSDVVVFDGALPYRDIPVYRISPGDFLGTSHGYTTAFDLLSLQEAYDALCSAVVTNQTTFGVQNIMIPTGHNVGVQQLAGGLNLIEYDPGSGPPQALNLTSTPPEVFNFIQKLEEMMETISGVNSVSRGNPEASLRSGNALALVQSMAIQFNSGLQQSYAQLIESVGTATINALKDFAVAPRIAMIAGKNNRTFVREFTGNDLDKIDRVVVDQANPLSKTTAGKIEIAQNLLNMGLIKTPQEYFTVLKTGNYDSMIDGDFKEIMLIHDENQNLQDANKVQALIFDDHALHMREHRSVLNSKEARENPEVVNAVLEHLKEHYELYQVASQDPVLLSLMGQRPIGAPEAGMPQEQSGEAAQAAGENAAIMNPESGAPGMPSQPSLPNNAMSGEPWNPESGGL